MVVFNLSKTSWTRSIKWTKEGKEKRRIIIKYCFMGLEVKFALTTMHYTFMLAITSITPHGHVFCVRVCVCALCRQQLIET